MAIEDILAESEELFQTHFENANQHLEKLLSGEDAEENAQLLWGELAVYGALGEYFLQLLNSGGISQGWLENLATAWMLTGRAKVAMSEQESARTTPDTLDSSVWGEARCAYLINLAYQEAQVAGGFYSPRMDSEMRNVFMAHTRVAYTMLGKTSRMLEQIGISKDAVDERIIKSGARGGVLFSRSIVGRKPNRESMH